MTPDKNAATTTLVGSLPIGSKLHEYEIQGVLGHGGFGITYLARDTHLDKRVAIKEYLPNDLAARAPDQTVTVRSDESAEAFKWGLASFIKEARVLGKFSHPSLIQVHRYFEANQTAYFVMEYAEGVTLARVLKNEGNLSEERLRKILFPILNGLEEVHKGGILHRDIKPENIILRDGTTPVLIDFGAARQSLSGMTQSVMSVLTAGYAPIEQYATGGNQGPWTDLYAIGAVAYRALSGKKPIDAINRIREDPMIPASTLGQGRYTSHFLAAIDWALAVNPEDRPQSIAEFKAALDGTAIPPASVRRAPSGAKSDVTPLARLPMPDVSEISGKTVITRPTPRGEPAQPAWRKPPLIGGVALVALVVGYLALRPKAHEPAPPAEAPAPGVATAPTAAPPTQQPAPAATNPPQPMPAPAASQQQSTAQAPTPAPAPAPAPAPHTPAPRAQTPPAPAPQTVPTPQAQTQPAPAAQPQPQTPPAPAPQVAQAPPPAAPAETPAPAAPATAKAPVAPRKPLVAQMKPMTTFVDCPHCPSMVALPATTFQMGARVADNGNAWEGPSHSVTLSQPFAIGRTEVTNAQWQACVNAKACPAAKPGPYTGDLQRVPVVNVTWAEANQYTAWLSQTTGRHYRLPTEAEWEYAIRAGQTDGRYWAGDRTKQCRYANGADRSALKRDPKLQIAECDDGHPVLATVGAYEANAFGLYDMAGNAWEWMQDCWRDGYSGAPTDGSAVQMMNCTQRSIRGGSWRARPNSLRSFARGNAPPDVRSEDLGLRVVAE